MHLTTNEVIGGIMVGLAYLLGEYNGRRKKAPQYKEGIDWPPLTSPVPPPPTPPFHPTPPNEPPAPEEFQRYWRWCFHNLDTDYPATPQRLRNGKNVAESITERRDA